MHRLILQSWPLRRLPFPDVISMSNSPSLSIVSRPVSDTQLLGDVSTGIFRPLVPAPFREHIIRSLHSVHHPGIRATARLVKASFCWPKMEKDITAVARSCMGCQLGKVQRHVTLEPEHIPVPPPPPPPPIVQPHYSQAGYSGSECRLQSPATEGHNLPQHYGRPSASF
jgi:hypothetical protein